MKPSRKDWSKDRWDTMGILDGLQDTYWDHSILACLCKTCHLLVKVEHKAYCAIKLFNFDLISASIKRKLQLNELNELRLEAYESQMDHNAWKKMYHNKYILLRRSFKIL